MKSWMTGKLAEYVVIVGVLLCTMPNALAVVRPPPVSPYDDGVAAAPEPAQLLLITGGLLLVSGYAAFRIRKNKAK